MLLWLIPTALVVWTAVALVGFSLCVAAARGDRELSPEIEPGDEPRARLARAS